MRGGFSLNLCRHVSAQGGAVCEEEGLKGIRGG